MIKDIQLDRYQRQIILPQVGKEGQKKLKSAKVLVVGAGGLGSPVLMYLAAAGVGTIGIVEYDKIDITNLQRQILYTTNHIGKDKLQVASNHINNLNPDVRIIQHNFRLSKNNALDLMKDFDVVVDGSDNFPTRFMVSDATVILNKPLVFGAVYQFIGQASVFNFKNGPTYRCVFPEQPKSGEMPSCSTGGVIGPLPGIIGSIQANETIKIILNIGETLSGRFLQLNSLTFKTDIIEVTADENNKKIKSLGDYDIICDRTINNISPEQLLKEKANPGLKIFDLRTPYQFESFNIGGEKIDTEELLDNPQLVKKYDKVVIVCQKGEVSLSVVDYLQNNKNMEHVYNLEGGIEGWLKEPENKNK